MCYALGPDKSRVLPLFHAFTGCDTVSAFGGKGKKSAWEAWNVYPNLTKAFLDNMQGIQVIKSHEKSHGKKSQKKVTEKSHQK
jgi:ABC-type transport system involved in cytochrome bd biosynthesis fused ATPase/permease subunit